MNSILVPTKHLTPKYPDQKASKNLVKSILLNGIIQPLTVNSEWVVLDGNKCLAAAKLLELKEVPVRIIWET